MGDRHQGQMHMVFDTASRLAKTYLDAVEQRHVGTTATRAQMAAALGNRVFATAGSDEKCAACVKLGAAKAINYRTQDFAAEVKAATGGKGVDVILDMVGGDYVPREISCMAEEGRLVFIAVLGGWKTELNIASVMQKRISITEIGRAHV